MGPQEAATFRGREIEIELLGQTWRFSRFTMGVLDDWTAWAGKQLPDPLDVATAAVEKLARREKALLAEKPEADADRQAQKVEIEILREQQERITRMAIDRATSYLDWNSPEMVSLRRTLRGWSQIFFLLLRDHQPALKDYQAMNLVVSMPEEMRERVISTTMGRAPKPAPEEQPAGAPSGNSQG